MPNESSLVDPDRPSREGRGIRFTFGLIFGFMVGFGASLWRAPSQLGAAVAWAVAFGVLVAFLSARFGDRFWFPFMSWLRKLFRLGIW